MAQKLKDFVQDAVVNQTADIIAATSPAEVERVASNVAEKTAQFNAGDDKFCFRAVVVILGFAVLLVGATYSIYALTSVDEKLPQIPDALIALGSAAIGALAGLLAPNPK